MTETRTEDTVRTFIHGMWANVAGGWAVNADFVDRRAAQITARMLDSIEPGAGDRVLELACGPGGAGLAAAERVGPKGEVVISDVVAGMVDIAVRRAKDRGLTNVAGEVLDFENIAQPDDSYDVVLCREGMMFALDPAQAAREMYRVLRRPGRVAVSVWASRAENPWLALLLDTIGEVTGVVLPPPGGPGPFALADPDALQKLFADAGFADMVLERVGVPLHTPSFDAWWERNLALAGPVVGFLNGLDDATRALVQAHARTAITRYETAGELELPGSVLLLTARRP